MYLIVRDSFKLSNQLPTDEEIADRATSWARHLFDVIPERLLEKCFDKAFEYHKGEFPINAHELKAVAAEVKNIEHDREVRRGRSLEATASSACQRCYGSGMEVVPANDGTNYRSARVCDHRPIEEDQTNDVEF